jgi:hypothetical protein
LSMRDNTAELKGGARRTASLLLLSITLILSLGWQSSVIGSHISIQSSCAVGGF